jgi:hypothetical protein
MFLEQSIDIKLSFLKKEMRNRFYNELLDKLYNPAWCNEHNLSPENVDKAKLFLFNEGYQGLFIKEADFEEISESKLPKITTPTAEELLLQ